MKVHESLAQYLEQLEAFEAFGEIADLGSSDGLDGGPIAKKQNA